MSNQNLSISEIIDTIRSEVDAVTSLSLILDEEFETLQKNSSEVDFSLISNKKEKQISVVEHAVIKRNIMQSNMEQDNNNEFSDQLIASLEKADISLESIETLLAEVKKKNMRNGIMINIRKNSLNKIIELVTGQSSDDVKSYCKNGKLESVNNIRSIVKI